MSNEAYFNVSGTVAELTENLTDNSTYIAQNTGTTIIEYCNYASDPATQSVSWFTLEPSEYIRFEKKSTLDKVWVRGKFSSNGKLSISDVQ